MYEEYYRQYGNREPRREVKQMKEGRDQREADRGSIRGTGKVKIYDIDDQMDIDQLP